LFGAAPQGHRRKERDGTPSQWLGNVGNRPPALSRTASDTHHHLSLRRINAASSRAASCAGADILVLNASILHLQRAQLDVQLAACSIDGRALAPPAREHAHGSVAGLLHGLSPTRHPVPHLNPRAQRTDAASLTCIARRPSHSWQRGA